jgi:TetR/AcrR family transcriptional regulator, transcriptional repressor for nem operon
VLPRWPYRRRSSPTIRSRSNTTRTYARVTSITVDDECLHGLTRTAERGREVGDRASGDRLSAIAALYLTSTHRDNPGAGCMLAALGPDVSRQGPAVRHAVTDYVRSVCELLAKLVPGKSKAARRQKAISTYATLVGAMVLARAVDDRALSQEILDAGLASVKV